VKFIRESLWKYLIQRDQIIVTLKGFRILI
jgi:hypothetical protein